MSAMGAAVAVGVLVLVVGLAIHISVAVAQKYKRERTDGILARAKLKHDGLGGPLAGDEQE